MALAFHVVMEQGRLRSLEPLPLRQGEEAEVTLVSRGESASDETLSDVLRDIRDGSSQFSAEWWDDFDRLIHENRVNFAERA